MPYSPDTTGYNADRQCYGIPAAKHPDYAALAASLKALHAAHETENHAAFAEMVERVHETRLEGGDLAALEREAMADQRLRGIKYRQARMALTDQIPTGLYRLMGVTLVVRYDRIGKWSWDREFERLGWTRGHFGWTAG